MVIEVEDSPGRMTNRLNRALGKKAKNQVEFFSSTSMVKRNWPVSNGLCITAGDQTCSA